MRATMQRSILFRFVNSKGINTCIELPSEPIAPFLHVQEVVPQKRRQASKAQGVPPASPPQIDWGSNPGGYISLKKTEKVKEGVEENEQEEEYNYSFALVFFAFFLSLLLLLLYHSMSCIKHSQRPPRGSHLF